MAYTTIDDPSAYFHTQLYSGDGGGSNAITNDANAGDFKPDWLWIKERTATSSHTLVDSTRGAGNILLSDNTNAEASAPAVSSLNTDGFTLGSDGKTNEVSQTYVAWQWKSQGGSTVSNSDGSITSTVQANTTAGFSIVTYTGNGSSGATIGHGLGAVPSMFIIKRRSGAEDWVVYHHKNTSAPETDHLLLNTTDATSDSDTRFNDTAPTSSLITMGNNAVINGSGSTYVCYAFKEIQGYSKFSSFTGTGNADGPMVFCGFSPSWVMIKKTNNTSQWVIHDTTRQEFNMQTRFLQANQNAAESTSSAADLDILSNGFKLRSSDDAQNGNGDTYIYLAFASSPLVGSDGTPCTAR